MSEAVVEAKPVDPQVLEGLVAKITDASGIVRTLKEQEKGEDELEPAILALMTLKIELTELVGVGGHELALNKSAYKKEKKKLEGAAKPAKVKQEFKQGEGRNSKLAKKMLEKKEAAQLVNNTPEGEKKILDKEMAKEYDPEAVEMAWYSWWEKCGFFKPRDDDETSERFVMVIPPPNVTGSLHLGHALTCSIEDSLTRWHRMCGKNVLWVPGTDHAGIATQVVVEKQLQKETGQTRQDLGREAFLEKVWEWKNAKGNHIYNQLRLTGASVDWSREAFTMGEKLSKAVNEAFCRLYEKGKIYRDTKLTDWCCTLQSVISKIEIDNVELEGETKLSVPGYDKKIDFGFIYSFAYKVVDSDEVIVVATTRPETMLGDTAVAIHPKDPRYTHLHGKFVQHPFVDRKIPIILDEVLVDMNFGTGAVKITPAHDPNDYACGKRHGLEFIDIMTDSGEMAANCGEFSGLKRFSARGLVMKKLDELGFGRGKANNPMTIPLCSRTGDILEPRIKPQWYCDCNEMAARAVAAVDAGELRLIPDNHVAVWKHWLCNIQDWCISRQLWWGHRIPAYFVDFKGEPAASQSDTTRWVVGRTEEDCKKIAAEKFGKPVEDIILTQDEDVLDTWFSSGLFPFSTMGWPEETNDMKMFFPGHLLETGWDILFFWVARMVMFSLELCDALPFKDVFLHSLVRDKYGHKMSKSRGNIIDPLWVVYGITLEDLHANVASGNLAAKEVASAQKAQNEQFPEGIAPCGSDGLRFSLLLNTSHGADINLDINGVVSCRNFCNKIWQATKLTMSNLEGFTPADVPLTGLTNEAPLALRWLISRLNFMVQKVGDSYTAYEFHDVAEACRVFFWEEFCDVFLEYTKRIFMNADHPARAVAQEVLYTAMDIVFRVMHPALPFLTEELWQRLPKRSGETAPSIMVAAFPKVDEILSPWTSSDVEAQMELVLAVAKTMRACKVNYKLAPKSTPKVVVRTQKAGLEELMTSHIEDFQKNSFVGEVQVMTGGNAPAGYVVASVNEELDILMELAGNVDVAAEVAKMEKEKAKLEQTRDKLLAEKADVARYSKKPADRQQADADRLAKLEQEIEQKENDINTFKTLA
mmetsp:Transcript_42485/g.76200  ORF Transcript_42485/g.76200 Transcript_42485/m.76200 type:complete len:1097 (-) Transcript_42485:331-3621(-)